MSKHTPGHWRLRTEHPTASDYVEIIIDTDEREILRVGGHEFNIHDFILMVSAPELYEALSDLLEIAQEISAFNDPATAPDMYAARVAAEEAIEKVGGRADV